MINFLHLKITQDYLIIQVGKYVTEATNGYLQTFQKLLWSRLTFSAYSLSTVMHVFIKHA